MLVPVQLLLLTACSSRNHQLRQSLIDRILQDIRYLLSAALEPPKLGFLSSGSSCPQCVAFWYVIALQL